jgi:lipopolysaccharide export system permease protein
MAGNVQKTREISLDLKQNFIMARSWGRELPSDQVAALTPEEREAYLDKLRTEREGMPEVSHIVTDESQLSVSLNKMFEKNAKLKVDGLTMSQLRAGLANPAALAVDGAIPPSHSSMLTELNRRLSFSLACFVLAFVGIPFGITAQRRETSVGFVLSLAVGISYFALIMLGGIWQNTPEKYPQIWVWVPNILFGLFGLFMFVRLQRR